MFPGAHAKAEAVPEYKNWPRLLCKLLRRNLPVYAIVSKTMEFVFSFYFYAYFYGHRGRDAVACI